MLGWEGFASGGIDVLDVKGDHVSIISEDNVRPIAGVLRKAVDGQSGKDIASSPTIGVAPLPKGEARSHAGSYIGDSEGRFTASLPTGAVAGN